MIRRGDDRAQVVQVGAIVLFAFLVLAFSGYQAVVVPNQNEAVEYRHSQEVTGDVQSFRNGLLEAAENGRRNSARFDLGTEYPPRLFALNPPTATGSLRTTPHGSGSFSLVAENRSLEDVCGYDRDGDGAVASSGLVYEPSYSVYEEAPTVVYENTVTYRRYEQTDTVRFDSNQTLIQGNRIQIPPLVGNVSVSGSRTHTVDLFPGKAGVGETAGEPIKLIVPTDLTVEHWKTLLGDQRVSQGGRVVGVRANGSDVEIELESEEYRITCPVVGAGETPDNRPDRLRGADSGIDSRGPGDVRLSDVELHPDDRDVVVVSFANPGDPVNVSDVRFDFYQGGNDPTPARLDMFNYSRDTTTIDRPPFVDDLELRGPAEAPDPVARLPGDDAVTAFAIEFEDASDATYDTKKDHFAVVTVRFSDGQRANYFIAVPEPSNTVSNSLARPDRPGTFDV